MSLTPIQQVHTRKPSHLTDIDWTHPIVKKGLIHAFVVNENGGVPRDLVQDGASWASTARALWGTDEDGMFLDFTPTGDTGVDCRDVPVTQALSVFAIAKRTSSMQYEHIIGRHPGWFFSGNAGQMRLGIDTGTNVNAHCEDVDPGTDNVAHAYGATYDGATVDAYKEGILNESNVQTGNIDLSGATRFGDYWGNGFAWNGNLYVVYVFKGVLTPHDHASLTANPWQLLKPKTLWASLVEAVGPTTYFQTNTGSITPAGALATATAFKQSVSGSITALGSIAKKTFKTMSGSTTPSGAITKKTFKNLFGLITPSGAITKKTSTTVEGSITPTGSLVASFTVLQAVAGSILMTGVVAGVVVVTVTYSLLRKVLRQVLRRVDRNV